MIIIQMTGLSGAGKTTIANFTKEYLTKHKIKTEVIDGDIYRGLFFPDLGFTKEERVHNINCLFYLAKRFADQGIIAIISSINPYEKVRHDNSLETKHTVKTVYIEAELNTLIKRDTKGLYKRAFLEDENPQKLKNLTGVSDVYDIPEIPDLLIKTDKLSIEESSTKLIDLILEVLKKDNTQ